MWSTPAKGTTGQIVPSSTFCLDPFAISDHSRPMTLPVLITGASRGLGAALAEILAPTHPIIAVGRTVGALEELDDRIKAASGTATLAPMDVTKPDAVAHLCKSIYDRWGGLALWAHTAIHAAPLSPVAHTGDKDFSKSFEVNVTATRHLIACVAPLLGQGSNAMFFDDAQDGTAFFASYGASKAAQMALAKSWAAEAPSTTGKIHILSPKPMPTATRARFYPGEDRTPLTPCLVEAKRLLTQVGVV